MAYDRYDRDERSRWSDRSGRSYRGDDHRGDDNRSQYNRGRDERGFWDRASDEVSSWFGDDEAERRRERDRMRDQRDQRSSGRGSEEHSAFGRGWGGSSDREYDRGYGRDYERDRAGNAQERDRSDRESNYDRGVYNRGGSSERDYNPSWRRELWGAGDRNENRDSDHNLDRGRGQSGYRPMAGDYGRGGSDRDYDRSQTPYGRDEYRRTSFAGSRDNDRNFDPHYNSWRDRHIGDLDRDYDDYRRENQSRFENDFSSWREKRQQKRGLLGQIREHMEVVGSDDEHVGTVDKVAGDRLILTKSDSESGGTHHSLSCSDVDRVEDDRVILDCKASDARDRLRDENRHRALFEREDQGEMGPRNLDRSFSGTYR